MKGLPVTVRLLDPPLHEFLPKTDKDMEEVARSLNLGVKEIKNRVAELHELNPMLGHRGCRLGISFPEIYEMQCRAIFTALIECKKEKIQSVIPEIMIPLVSTEDELGIMRKLVNKVADQIQKEHKVKTDNINNKNTPRTPFKKHNHVRDENHKYSHNNQRNHTP